MECKQPHYFFIILGEDSFGILIVIPCERMMIRNCITAKVTPDHYMILLYYQKKVQVGKDQEKAQSEKDSHSKNQGGKKPN